MQIVATLCEKTAGQLLAFAQWIRNQSNGVAAPFAFDPTFVGGRWEVRNPNRLPSPHWGPADLRWVPILLRSGEVRITGEENKNRLAGKTLLGVEAFWRCWQNRHLIPEELKDKIIFFDGDEEEVLLSPSGAPYSLYLYWIGDEWRWYCRWLGRGRNADCVSACAS